MKTNPNVALLPFDTGINDLAAAQFMMMMKQRRRHGWPEFYNGFYDKQGVFVHTIPAVHSLWPSSDRPL